MHRRHTKKACIKQAFSDCSKGSEIQCALIHRERGFLGGLTQ